MTNKDSLLDNKQATFRLELLGGVMMKAASTFWTWKP